MNTEHISVCLISQTWSQSTQTHDSIFTWKTPIFAIYCCDGLSFTKEEQLVHIWNTLTLKISLELFPFSQ